MSHAERRAFRRERATEYVEAIREVTFCENCGNQPIDWHHDDHPEKPNTRVSALRAQGASLRRIQFEIERCEALCRSCHMEKDGRIAKLQASRPYQAGRQYVPPMPCGRCTKLFKPLRRGMCYSCYVKSMGIR